jgi:type IV secretory pathway TraG/TraD family ATPase VirD4
MWRIRKMFRAVEFHVKTNKREETWTEKLSGSRREVSEQAETLLAQAQLYAIKDGEQIVSADYHILPRAL